MNKKFLNELLDTVSPSGDEWKGIRVWEKEMEEFGEPYYQDKMLNTAYSVGTGPCKVLISGHIDEICMAIGLITQEGYVVPRNMAGIDRKVLPGSEVIIVSSKKGTEIIGTVQKNPIHIEYSEEKAKDKVLDFCDLRIDIGAESKEDAQELVEIGDLIVLGRSINLKLGKHRFYGNSLDDKAGVFVVSEVMKNLLHDNPRKVTSTSWRDKYTVIGLACTGEESGLLGAHRVAHNINPDISIDLDVTHACDTGQFDKTKYGEIYLGKGPVIEYGQDKSRRLNSILSEIAEKENIEVQKQVSRIGGTNTKAFYLEGGDTETTLISLPLTSMHTPIETMDYRDIEGTIKLLTETIKSCQL
jgi:endoglucanase